MFHKNAGISGTSFTRPGMGAARPMNSPLSGQGNTRASGTTPGASGTGAPKTIVVNNRNLGTVGSLSNSFGTTANSGFRDKMQLKTMMVKAGQSQYQSNPIHARRLQNQIAAKASNVYGYDKTKAKAVTKAWAGSMGTNMTGVKNGGTGAGATTHAHPQPTSHVSHPHAQQVKK